MHALSVTSKRTTRWALRLSSLGPLLMLSGALGACQARHHAADRPAPETGISTGESATWLYHPLEKATPTARLEISNQDVQLEVDEAGSRWLLKRGKEPEPSAFGAPEPLVAAAKDGEGFLALGKSGTVYFFDEPLGPFVSVRTPPQPFVHAQQVGTAFVALDRSGKIVRSDDRGRSWSVLKRNEFFAGISAAGEGEVIGYSVPEQWFRSTDGGRNFEPLRVESVAPIGLESRFDGTVVVDGIFERYLYSHGQFQAGEIIPVPTNGYVLPKYGGALQVDARHAALVGDQYIEVRSHADKGKWKIAQGVWREPLSELTVPGPAFCHRYQIVAGGETLVLLCATSSAVEVAPPFEVYRWANKSDGFVKTATILRGDLKQVDAAASSGGRIAMLGTCPPERAEAGCSPEGVTLVESDGEVTSWSVPGLPQPNALAFDREENLWVAGHRQKDRHSLVVGPRKRIEDIPQILDLTELASFPEADLSPFVIFPGASDLLTVARVVSGTHYLATLANDGTILGRGSSPAGANKVHGAGQYLAALQVNDSVFWESTSGGITWTKRALPRPLCGSSSHCDPALVCSERGCLVGDELTRVGWGEQTNVSPSRVAEQGNRVEESSQTAGLVCRPTANGWQSLVGLNQIPDISAAAQGNTLWSELESYPNQAAVNALRVGFSEESLRREVLFPPVSDAETYAFATFPQVEGGAAIRFKKPPSHLSTHQTTIEVVWDNRFENVTGQGSISGDWGRRPMYFESRSQLSDLARPSYVGVAGDGLYLQLEDEGLGNQGSYFFQGRGKTATIEQLFDKKWPHETRALSGWFSRSRALSTARVERVHTFGRAGALHLIAGSRVVVRAWEKPGQAGVVEFSPYLMSSLSAESGVFEEGVHVAYRGTQIGFVAIQVDSLRGEHQAHFVGLGETQAFDAPLAVPLLPDLATVPRTCGEQERASTPRVIAPSFPGPRRSVRVLGMVGDVFELETRRAVLFGSKREPCLAVFEATRQRELEDKSQYGAFIAPGPTDVSWLFRSETQLQNEQIFARPMRCEFEASGFSDAL